MPLRTHKYDLPAFANTLTIQERRYRKGFYFMERLMELNPEFRQAMQQIRARLGSNQISEQEANALTHLAIMQAIRPEKGGR